MGIQYLNSYIKKNVSNESLVKISLKMLKGKIIAVDISIYLYRYLAEGELIENIYHMLSIFYYYDIIPIFIFDGKPPIEKYKLIQKRNDEKNQARLTYKKLRQELENNNYDINYENKLIENMENLKKKFIRLENYHLDKVKKLITAFGFSYLQANCEADVLCGKLVNKNIAWACMSEDMDMFLYGCSRVLRYFSIINHTAIIYNLKNILDELNLTFKEFKEICVISGTDYNLTPNTNLYKTLQYFQEYKKSTKKLDFFEWLENNTNYVDNIYYLYNIFYMFKTDNIQLKEYNINLKKKDINYDMIKEMMQPEGFIFT